MFTYSLDKVLMRVYNICIDIQKCVYLLLFGGVMNKKLNTKQITMGAILTALVIILQLLGQFVRFGPFQVSLVLVPIVIGAASCGVAVAGWLGFVFGLVVLLNGDAAAFLAVNAFGTVLTVLLKGIACGVLAGIVYKLVSKKSKYLAVVLAAIVCPLTNTGVFLIGCLVFFMDTVAMWGEGLGYANTAEYVFLGLVGGNFLFELVTNIVLSPVVVKLLDFGKKIRR